MEDERDITAVSGLTEDLRDVLLEYWVSIGPVKLAPLLSLKLWCSDRWHNNRQFAIRIVG